MVTRSVIQRALQKGGNISGFMGSGQPLQDEKSYKTEIYKSTYL